MPVKFGGYRKKLYLCTRLKGTTTCKQHNKGSVAQLNRASDYGSEGSGFESQRSHKKSFDCRMAFFYVFFSQT